MSPATETIDGQRAVVTGGSRGIGLAVARRLVQLGASVTIIARDVAVAEAVAAKMGARAVGADVTRAEEIERAFEAVEAASGPTEILINNVGGAESAAFLDTDRALWQRMFDANVLSAYLCTQRVLPAMLENGGGRIVNVASNAGLRGYPYVSAYVAAKHAVVGFTRALAQELSSRGVTVNAVCPGFADTELTTSSATTVAKRTGKSVAQILASYAATNAHGRLITPDEIAERVAWFCLPAQGGVTGEVVEIDGSEEGR